MAAKNTDSKRIFDLYVERYLTEQETMTRDEAEASVQRRQDSIKQQQDAINSAARSQQAPAATTGAAPAATTGSAPAATSGTLPTPEQNSAYFKQQADAIRATDPKKAAMYDLTAARQADPTMKSPEAQKAQQTAYAPTQEEKDLFKKLHGSEYTPGETNANKLAQLRRAAQQTGTTDVNKLAAAAYSQQYADTDKGAAYTAQAQKAGVSPESLARLSRNPSSQGTAVANAPATPPATQGAPASQSAPAAPATPGATPAPSSTGTNVDAVLAQYGVKDVAGLKKALGLS